MTERRNLTGQSLAYLAAAAANAAIPFLVLPLFTRWLGPAGFGMLATFLATVNVLAILVGLGTYGRITVAYYKEGAETLPTQVGATLGVMLLTGLPVLIVLMLASPWLTARTGIPAAWLPAAWLCACGTFVIAATSAVWQSRMQPWRYGATQIGYALLWTALALPLVAVVGMGWTGRALGQAIAAGIAIASCLSVLSAAGALDWHPRRWPMQATFAFGLPLLPHTLAAVVMGTVDRFALKGAVGEAATGQYFAAFQIASLFSAGASALNSAWMPWMYERLARKSDAANHEVVRATYAIYALMLAGAAFVSLLAGPIVRFIAGPEYGEAASLLRLLAPSAAFGGMYYFVTGYLFYSGRTGVLSTITLSVAAIQTILTLWLIRRDGAHGVAVAAVVSTFLYCTITAIVANRIIPMPWLLRRSSLTEQHTG